MTDIHSHILHGVDDGSPDMEHSLGILGYYAKTGIKRVVLTPHIMEDYPDNTYENLKEVFNKLEAANNTGVELRLAAEYMLDNRTEYLLDKEKLLVYKEGFVLVETSYFNPPLYMEDRLYKFRVKGYTPILAHPERYIYLREDGYEKLLSGGVCFQLNLLSLLGGYGKEAQERADALLKKGCYEFVGTDIHSLMHFSRFCEMKKLNNKSIKALGELIVNNNRLW